MSFIERWFKLVWQVKSHPQLDIVALLLHLRQHVVVDNDDETIVVVRWGDNSDHVERLGWRQKRGRDNDF